MKKSGNMKGHLYRKKKLQDCPLSTILTTLYGNVQEFWLFFKMVKKNLSALLHIFVYLYAFFFSFFFVVFVGLGRMNRKCFFLVWPL